MNNNAIYKICVIAFALALPLTLMSGKIILKAHEYELQYKAEDRSIVDQMDVSYESIPHETIEFNNVEEEHTDDLYNVEYIDNVDSIETIEIDNNLTEKYSSIFEWMSTNSACDFDANKLAVLNKYCEQYDVPMELMLALICHESSFTSTAMSDDSSASGYCQIIRGTAESIYEDTLQYGSYDSYNHEYIMTSNWELNLEIGVRYMRTNYEENYHSWEHAIYAYHGGDNSQNMTYFNNINKRVFELFSISVCDLT